MDCSIDLVFICNGTNGTVFQEEVDLELFHLFEKLDMHWYLQSRNEMGTEIVIAEVRGPGRWKDEEEVISFWEQQATPEFWKWLQGYRIKVHPDERECGIDHA